VAAALDGLQSVALVGRNADDRRVAVVELLCKLWATGELTCS
jgi:hypothetical protein